MLYFRFNTESKHRIDEIESYFFNKLTTELGLKISGIGTALYDVLGVPIDSFGVDDEIIGNCDGVLKYIFEEYSKLPIEKLDNKSLRDLGIKIDFCKRINNNDIEKLINNYMRQEKLSYITEEVLWKKMNDKQKAEKFSLYFSEISSEGNELIIVDPYLFKDDSDEYCNLLASIINSAKARSVIVVTEKKNYKKLSYNKINDKIGHTMEIKYNSEFHDRFWIADRKKGFYTGTSLNGIGKKISLINFLSSDDVTEIVSELHHKDVI